MIKCTIQNVRGTYYASFRIKDNLGRSKQKFISTGVKAERGNKRKAESKLKEILEKYEHLTLEETGESTLCEYMENWLNRIKKDLQATTYDNYVHMFKKHIKPYFEHKKIKLINLKPLYLEKYYACKIDEGLSPNTVIKHHAIIRTALQDAVKNGFILKNPADFANKPKHKKPSHDFYTADELKKLLQAVKETDIELPVFFAVFFGLRRSECIGLKWKNIDFENHTIHVCEKVTRKNVDGKTIDVASNEMKTETSNSVFYMNDFVENYLKNVKEHQESMPRITNEFRDYVCVNKLGERLKVDFVTHKFEEMLDKNNLRHIRFHDLRHSCISLLIKNNFNMKTVQGYARHADYNLTANTYSHIEDKMKISELDCITEILVK